MQRTLFGAGLCAIFVARLYSQAAQQQSSLFRADPHLVQVSVVVQDDPAAHTLRIAVRDPATGSVGSVAVSADMIRSVLGK